MLGAQESGLTSFKHRSYGDGTSFFSLIRKTGGVKDRTWDPWTGSLACKPLLNVLEVSNNIDGEENSLGLIDLSWI